MKTHSQRWRERRESFRLNGELFDPRRHAVDLIPQQRAKRFVVQHHYSGTFVYAIGSVGLFEVPTAAHPAQLVGVAAFATPSNPRTFPSYCGLDTREGAELGRFVLLDHVASNAETWFLARALRLLREVRPSVRAVLAYSDPVPRTAVDGSVTLCGHLGRAYIASSATYLGRGRPRTLFLTPDGRALANRIFNKIRAGECGHRYAEAAVRDGIERLPDEDADAYLNRALHELRSLRHPGNHVYLFPVGGSISRKSLLAAEQVRRRAEGLEKPKALDLLLN